MGTLNIHTCLIIRYTVYNVYLPYLYQYTDLPLHSLGINPTKVQQPAGLVDRAKAGDVKAKELMSSGMLATFGRPLALLGLKIPGGVGGFIWYQSRCIDIELLLMVQKTG